MVIAKQKNVECSKCGNLLAYTQADTTHSVEKKRTTHKRAYFAPVAPCTDFTETWTIECPVCGNVITVGKKCNTEFD